MKKNLVIIGGGGHGAVCKEIAELIGYKNIIILDDDKSNASAYGKTELFTEFINDSDFFVAIGNNSIRKSFVEKIVASQGTFATLIHPSAVISKSATIGQGTVVMAGAVINARVKIGDGVIVNTGSSVDHDCKLDVYSHIGVGAHLAGTVHVGKEVFVGAGTIIINNISIVQDVILGAGTTVVSDIAKQGTYIGTPARKLK